MLPGKTYAPQDIAEMVWRRRWIIATPLVICAFGALLVSARLVDLYQSDMLIQIVPQRVPDSYVRSTVTMRTEDRIQSLYQQIVSRTQLEHLIREFDLFADDRARLPLQDVVETMRNRIEVEVEAARNGPRGPESPDAFHVRFTYADPAMAARVTERLGSLFANYNARDRGSLSQSTNRFLKDQLTESRSRLEAQEQKLEGFRRQNAGRLPSQLDSNLQAIQSTQLQLQALVESIARERDRKLILERLLSDAQEERSIVSAAPGATAASPQQDSTTLPTGASLAQQLQAARALLARLELRLTPEHPDIVRAKREIEELQKKADAEMIARADGGAPPTPLVTAEEQALRDRLRDRRTELESIGRNIAFKESEEARLRAQIADYQRRIEAIPGIESDWIALTRDYDTIQQSYRDLLGKSEEAKVAADLERQQIGEQFRVLDAARAPVTPIGHKRLQTNGVGVALGLFLGLGLAALLEFRDTSFHTPADVLDVLSLPVLALIPLIETEGDRRRRERRRLLASGAVAIAALAGTYVFWSMQLWKHIV